MPGIRLTPDSPAASEGPIHAAAEALRQRLEAGFPPPRFHHELLPAPLTARVLAELASRRTPFVGLAFLGVQPAASQPRKYQGRMRWGVYLVASNTAARGRLLGDRLGPGLAQMVHAAIITLHGWTLAGERDGGLGTISVQGVESTDGAEWAKDNTVCAAMTLDLDATFTAATADELERLASSWAFATTDEDIVTDTWERAQA
jgi:hypothetical protein